VAFRGKHPGQKKQITRLHRFHIGAKRLRRRREFDAKVLSTAARRRPAKSLHGLPSIWQPYNRSPAP
jgi:hypothetical protein